MNEESLAALEGDGELVGLEFHARGEHVEPVATVVGRTRDGARALAVDDGGVRVKVLEYVGKVH